jgi:hypothetical protein
VQRNFSYKSKRVRRTISDDEGYHKNCAEEEAAALAIAAVTRSSVEEIMNSILPGGDLYDSVNEWFE